MRFVINLLPVGERLWVMDIDPREQIDLSSLLHRWAHGAKLSLTLEAPIVMASNPLRESFDVFLDLPVNIRAP